MIFSVPCEHLIRENYDEKSLVRCSEGLGVFLELIIALREVHFAIEVSGESFQLPGTPNLLDPVPGPEGTSEDLVVSLTDADIAAAVGVLPSQCTSVGMPVSCSDEWCLRGCCMSFQTALGPTCKKASICSIPSIGRGYPSAYAPLPKLKFMRHSQASIGHRKVHF